MHASKQKEKKRQVSARLYLEDGLPPVILPGHKVLRVPQEFIWNVSSSLLHVSPWSQWEKKLHRGLQSVARERVSPEHVSCKSTYGRSRCPHGPTATLNIPMH